MLKISDLTYDWKLSDIDKVQKNKLKVFSFFAGAGGSSMGYKLAGCDVLGCLDIDKVQLMLYKDNLKPKYAFCDDIREFFKRDDIPKELFNLDIFDASAPCTLFCGANMIAEENKGKKKKFKEGQAEQVLDDLFFEAIKGVERLKPKVVIFENVMGLLFKKNKTYVDKIINKLTECGYKVSLQKLFSEDFGVPQKRHRAFFFAVRDDIGCKVDLANSPVFNFKKYAHVKFSEIQEKKSEQGTLKEDSRLKFLWNKRIDTDNSLEDVVERTEGKKHSLFSAGFIKKDKVCLTITGGKKTILYDYPRYMSDTEVVKCGSFPRDYNFYGTSVVYSVGMSVPPLMIARIADDLIKQIDFRESRILKEIKVEDLPDLKFKFEDK
jgi:DNA (cytosine-5)-methyltransferase 1